LELVAEVEEALKIEEKKVNIFRDSDVKSLRRIVLAFAVGFFQEMNGCALIAYFSAILFSQNLGFSEAESLLLGGFLNLAYWCGSLPNIWVISTDCRMVVFTIGLSVNTKASQYLCLVMIYCFIGASWLVIPYLYSAEITPLHLRHVGGATGVFSALRFCGGPNYATRHR
jgi:hypothetical protein